MVVFVFRRRKGKEDYSAKSFHQLRSKEADNSHELRLSMSWERSLVNLLYNN